MTKTEIDTIFHAGLPAVWFTVCFIMVVLGFEKSHKAAMRHTHLHDGREEIALGMALALIYLIIAGFNWYMNLPQ